ncbi:NAD(P)-binding protein [Mycena venus]|uniref:NAD(P)-binding protein n=1 Tax=Mycena venus TaxID=2733690 RepID=A0A8H6YL88_9AGAR|nr:NAD(P)-binding protein [Mycena venus]
MARRTVTDQRSFQKPLLTADLTGKVIIITGANTGLGLESAKHFAKMNPLKIILTSRDEKKGNAALSKLIEETNFQRAEVWALDLNSFESVKQFADKTAQLERLDFLVANAGIGDSENYTVTEDGWQSAIQVNNLSQELLALLLLPKMLETANRFGVFVRLVVVSSGGHVRVKEYEPELLNATNIHETLSSKEYFDLPGKKSTYYTMTKLLNVLFARALSNRSSSSFIAVSLNPGFCFSELRRNMSPGQLEQTAIMDEEYGLTGEEGGSNIVYGVTAGHGNPKEEEKLRGQYIAWANVEEPSDFVMSEKGHAMENRVWDETVQILTKIDARVGEIIKEYLH